MSGSVKNNVFGSSGVVLAAAGGLSWQDVVTASTVTVEAGKGYWINTTSNACTVTLPSSPAVGDQIILGDYARTWDTNAITIDSNGNNFQGEADTYTVDYDTEGQTINLVYADSTKGWIPTNDIANALTPAAPTPQRGIFAFGYVSSVTNVKNLVGTNGVVSADVTGVGTARRQLGGAGYGLDKAVYAYGFTNADVNVKNLVNNSGVVQADVTGVGAATRSYGATMYGGDKAIFAYGIDGDDNNINKSNLVSNTGVTNLVNNSGVVASDTAAVGTAKGGNAAAGYGYS